MTLINHQQWLNETTKAFAEQSQSALLDARVLLCFALDKPLSYLLTWPLREIEADILVNLKSLRLRRLKGEPIAYITGVREFWSLDFKVSSEVLIPRPETERLVEFALECIGAATREASHQTVYKTLELGTGSGAISVALATEHPELHFLATDFSHGALSVAKTNAELNNCKNITFKQGSWFDCLSDQQFDLIVSNPPYVAPDDPHLSLGDLPFEPIEALAAKDAGFADIKTILSHAPRHLKSGGKIALEHGYNQAEIIRKMMTGLGYLDIQTYQDLANIDRITIAKISQN